MHMKSMHDILSQTATFVGTIDSYYEASMEWLNRLPGNHRLAESGSVIAADVRIHRSAEVIDSILMPGVDVGPGARIHRAILDENVQVMLGAQIGHGIFREIVVVPANSVVHPVHERTA
jgi:ADP-glucose pyrophosphorylase